MSRARPRLELERLEDRCLLATFTIGPGGNFATIQAALADRGVADGDTLQVLPTPGGVEAGIGTGNSTLLNNVTARSSVIQVADNSGFLPGDAVVFGSGATRDPVIIDQVLTDGVTLLLRSQPDLDHSAGETVQEFATGVSKGVTITGNPSTDRPQLNGSLWAAASSVTVEHLNLPSGSVGGDRITTLTISDNILNETILLKRPFGVTITDNTIRSPTGAGIEAMLRGLGADLTISDNQIQATSDAILLRQVFAPGPVGQVDFRVSKNVLSTSQQGVGINFDLAQVSGAGVLVVGIIEENNLDDNKIGLQVLGDGQGTGSSAGVIDAGGGSLGSLGQNTFCGYDVSDIDDGQYAIVLARTGGPAATLSAQNNFFSRKDPTTVIKDGSHNTAPTSALNLTGEGTIDVRNSMMCPEPDPNRAFVRALYLKVLEREGDEDEVDYWVGELALGVSRDKVALDFELSEERLRIDVDEGYEIILGRAPDASGRSYWVDQLFSGETQTDTFVVALFLSPEYLATHGPLDVFIEGVFRDVLQRSATPSDVSFFTNLVENGGGTRELVVLIVLGSDEAWSDAVRSDYQVFLDRTIDPSGEAFWVDQIQAGLNPDTLAAAILGSDEFFAYAPTIVLNC